MLYLEQADDKLYSNDEDDPATTKAETAVAFCEDSFRYTVDGREQYNGERQR